MLQAFREHKRWLMVIAMVFIIPSFVVTGIYSYNRMTQSDNSIVKVGEVKILIWPSASSLNACVSRWVRAFTPACSIRLRLVKTCFAC